jgi:GH15 family glucan-1,4-alpha-glucosidase
MPRDIPVGNGKVLVAFDRDYRIRDVYFPHVGKENHATGAPFRFGFRADERMSWVGPGWGLDLRYLPETLVTDVRGKDESLEIAFESHDAVDFHEDLFIRELKVRNLAPRERRVQVFFHQDFCISESDIGDTALYDPQLRALVHYKGPRFFLVGVEGSDLAPDLQYATGVKGQPGREGTWRDAEDGSLGRNPIAQGSVDSTLGVDLTLGPNGESTLFYWIAIGRSHREVRLLDQLIRQKTPARLLHRTAEYWRFWVNSEDMDFAGLPEELVQCFKRSLLVVRTQIDDGGAIIAANDSDVLLFNRDTYSYVWPRDGALVAMALDKAGFFELSKRFYFFCKDVIREEGYFLHKYNPDGTLASSWHPWVKDGKPQLPIQEDETALVLIALWRHFEQYRNVEFIKPLFRPLVTRAADFLDGFRDPATGLPKPSYDLWEERQGIHSFTTATVWGGLDAASRFCAAFGETQRSERYKRAAAEVREAMDRHLYRPELGRFARMITPDPSGFVVDPTLDASLCGIFAYGPYAPKDPKVVSTMAAVRDKLWVKTPVGGVARYEGDPYHRVSADVPGNPWFICTLWLAHYLIGRAETEAELEEALPIIGWAAERALPSGILGEQVDPFTDAPLSVSPLTWSHAMVVQVVMEYLEKIEGLRRCASCGNSTYRYDIRRRGPWGGPPGPIRPVQREEK